MIVVILVKPSEEEDKQNGEQNPVVAPIGAALGTETRVHDDISVTIRRASQPKDGELETRPTKKHSMAMLCLRLLSQFCSKNFKRMTRGGICYQYKYCKSQW